MKHKLKQFNIFNLKTVIMMLLACIIISGTGLATVYAGSYVGWNSMREASIAYSTDSYYMVRSERYKTDDIYSYSHNQTIRTASYEAGDRFFDDINWKAGDTDASNNSALINARLWYERKFKSRYGQKMQVVAATNDTETQGGVPLNDGKTFYYCITEWDSDGNLVYDSNWMPTSREWKFGFTENGYYPPGQNLVTRKNNASYFVLYFRWNTGDITQGTGTEPISGHDVTEALKNIYIVYNDFTYTFDAAGGVMPDNGGNRYQINRFGLTEASAPAEPTRDGYRFTGWKVTTYTDEHSYHCGMQEGHVYTTEELNELLSDGKFYSSFFDDAYLTAQWERTRAKIDYHVNGGYLDGSVPEYTVRTDSFIRRKSDTNQPIHTVESGDSTAPHYAEDFGLKKAGYRLEGWKIYGTDIMLYPGTDYSYDTYAAHLGATGYCDLYAVWKTLYTDTTVRHYVMGTDGRYPSSPEKTQTIKLKAGDSFEEDYGEDFFIDSGLLVPNAIEFAYMSVSRDYISEDPSENTVDVYYRRLSYPVVYNVSENGGSWSSGSSADVREWVYYGGQVDLSKTGTKGGWDFAGWNTDKDATSGLGSYTMGTSGITLYGVYKKDITIGFTDAQGRRTVSTTIYNKTESAQIDTPVIRDYDSWTDVSAVSPVGWSESGNVNSTLGASAQAGQGVRITVTDSDEYYGVYRADATVRFDENGGNANAGTADRTVKVYRNSGNLTVTKGDTTLLPECDRDDEANGDGTLTVYTLKGWTDDDTYVFPQGGAYYVTGDVTLKALWDSTDRNITYKIVFDGNGGKGVPDPITVTYGAEVFLPDKGSRVGFDLESWNTKPDGTGQRFDLETYVKNLTTEDGATVTLYAQWRQRRFLLVKIGSSRYGATFVRRTPGDDEWYNSTGKITINQWAKMTEEEKDSVCVRRYHISKDGTITRIK